MAKKVMLKKEIVLLEKSKVLEEYPILKSFIKTKPNILDKDIDSLNEQEKTFFRDIYPLVVASAAREWTQDKRRPVEIIDNKKENRICELCHHSHLQFVCYIVNTRTKETLQVGCECVKHFAMADKVSINEQIAQNKKLKNMEEINERIHGIKRIINSWKRYIENLPILIPENLRTNYQELGDRIEVQYNAFILLNPFDAHGKEELIQGIEKDLLEATRIKKQISQYVESNRDNKFIPKRAYLNYLESKRDTTGAEWLEKDACILPRTFFRIDMKELMLKFRNETQNLCKKLGFRLFEVVEHGYDLEWERNRRIHLLIGHSDLMRKCGKEILQNQPSNTLDEAAIIRMGFPRRDEGTYYEILKNLCDRVLNDIQSVDLDLEYDEAVFEKDGLLYVAPLQETIKKYKDFALYVEESSGVVNSIIGISQKMTKKEYNQRTQERQKAYTTQREFI